MGKTNKREANTQARTPSETVAERAEKPKPENRQLKSGKRSEDLTMGMTPREYLLWERDQKATHQKRQNLWEQNQNKRIVKHGIRSGDELFKRLAEQDAKIRGVDPTKRSDDFMMGMTPREYLIWEAEQRKVQKETAEKKREEEETKRETEGKLVRETGTIVERGEKVAEIKREMPEMKRDNLVMGMTPREYLLWEREQMDAAKAEKREKDGSIQQVKREKNHGIKSREELFKRIVEQKLEQREKEPEVEKRVKLPAKVRSSSDDIEKIFERRTDSESLEAKSKRVIEAVRKEAEKRKDNETTEKRSYSRTIQERAELGVQKLLERGVKDRN